MVTRVGIEPTGRRDVVLTTRQRHKILVDRMGIEPIKDSLQGIPVPQYAARILSVSLNLYHQTRSQAST